MTSSRDSAETISTSVVSPNAEDQDALASAWSVANKTPAQSASDKVLEQSGEIFFRLQSRYLVKYPQETQVSGSQAIQGGNAPLIGGVLAVLPAVGGLEAIEQGVNHFLEGSAVLMKTLDEVAKLHPFVGGAVRQAISC